MTTSTQNCENLFLDNSDSSLTAMEQKSKELKIRGVGIIAFLEDGKENWVSKMKVMGALKNEKVNFLAVAYSKAGEMVDTLKNSGTSDRTPLLGEFNFLGGLIEKVNNGYVLVVFSGATGEEDTVVAEVGLEFILSKLK
ncbi:hypothetical protein [Flavobacterium muglaense]|uniref:Uncharacterized protein n=1 Tax=Flavobacterium muglaense TaxID=2764716 RepID=A0A923N205_9FLAO|nr:hypothetical protein [Flavobacterium muglaense]MBC5839285.1 hypothetical protein [Flavobacterium muglaense]MBC5845797.1 hypothetical protein [Flavobacterium muglaense]